MVVDNGQVLDFTGGKGWAAGDLQLPASWYAEVHARTGVGYPVSGDLTRARA